MIDKRWLGALERKQREEADQLARRLATTTFIDPGLSDAPSTWWSLGLFVLCALGYGVLGAWLILAHNYVFQDGISRVANGSYILFSRNPHLAAVGFVWNPLPSVVEIPFLYLKYLWQPMLSRGIAGVIMSALFMAGAVLQLRGILIDRGLTRWWRTGLCLAFALNPMIIIYGGNGMSEAPYLFFTIWAIRRLMRWVYTDSVGDLVVAGLAMGLCYMTRYEAVALGGGAMMGVFVLRAYKDRALGWKAAGYRGILDSVVLGYPLLISFLFWTLASWVITGDALAQFSSAYGNSAQTASSAFKGVGSGSGFVAETGGPLMFVLRSLLSLEPLCPAIAIAAILVALWRHERVIIPILSTFGALVAFELYGASSGSLFPWLRFFLLVVPVSIILLATVLPPSRVPPSGSRRPAPKLRQHLTPRALNILCGVFAAVCLTPAFATGFFAMVNPNVGSYEYGIRSVIWPNKFPASAEPQLAGYAPETQLAHYIDAMGLPKGSVLVDTWLGWPIVISSKSPTTFVITSDFDFTRDLNAPTEFGVRYFLLPPPKDQGILDAVNRRYHTLYDTGGGFATLVLDVPSIGTQPEWRMYRIDSNPLDVRSAT